MKQKTGKTKRKRPKPNAKCAGFSLLLLRKRMESFLLTVAGRKAVTIGDGSKFRNLLFINLVRICYVRKTLLVNIWQKNANIFRFYFHGGKRSNMKNMLAAAGRSKERSYKLTGGVGWFNCR